MRTAAVRNLQTTLSLWYLRSASELQQSGDTGGTVPSSQPSNRYGVEWTNFYTPLEHLAFDFDLATSRARFTAIDDGDAAPNSPGGKRVPEAVGLVISSGITLHDYKRFSSSLRLRNFGPRDLTSDGIYRSKATILLNADVGYQINNKWRFVVPRGWPSWGAVAARPIRRERAHSRMTHRRTIAAPDSSARSV